MYTAGFDSAAGRALDLGRLPMPDKHQLHELVDQLPESEMASAVLYLESLVAQEAPVDEEMLARIDTARKHPTPGISHADILREFGV